MSLLILEDLKKHFGPQEVLRGTSLSINPGQKVGIVGRNGGGKTTLFHMITGEETPDWGRVVIRKGARMSFVPQRPVFEPDEVVRAHVESGLDAARQVGMDLEYVGEKMGSATGIELERLMREHDRLTGEMETLDGWDLEHKVEKVLSGIGLAKGLWDRKAKTLSGGEQNRVSLARALVGGGDLLLLDEPTNHLDLEGIEWLEKYLREIHSAILVVSHDRRLLTNSVERILELEFGQLNSFPGNYARYVDLKAERYETNLKAYEQQREMLRREESFIKKHMGSQRTAEAKGRLKKLGHITRLERPHHDVRRPIINPPEAARGGEKVLGLEHIKAGYGDNVLLSQVNLRLGRGQRIGLIGSNGSGKTTLLKIMAGVMAPLAGEVVRGHGEECAYFDQDTSHLRSDSTPFSEILRHYPKMTDLEIRSHLAMFLFRGEGVDKEISTLSGGERARMALALMVLTKPSWLAMDEPTNHLDLAGRTALEEMLGRFQGAIICISHDREFLDGLTSHTWEVHDNCVLEYEGNYSAWRAAKQDELEANNAQKTRIANVVRKREETKAKATSRKADRQAAPRKLRKKSNPWKLAKIEARIMKLESKLAELNKALTEKDVYSSGEKLRDTQYRIAEVEQELQKANEEWESFA
ncbi:MAG TPA: ABC transporter ATP-binding protein [Planctomycetes bacterium]|nr:ABC transporter ATP-binding protein [Planctomycetota bacterium]HIL36723.1 ABC transporter ATP-binding protein [Planctomycetota bacterium]